jgi:hypothetical protein
VRKTRMENRVATVEATPSRSLRNTRALIPVNDCEGSG